jgi:hypothetical protein
MLQFIAVAGPGDVGRQLAAKHQHLVTALKERTQRRKDILF